MINQNILVRSSVATEVKNLTDVVLVSHSMWMDKQEKSIQPKL